MFFASHRRMVLLLARIDDLLERLRELGAAQADIQAIFLVGSHARGEARADSDVDVVILTETPERYSATSGFVHRFGKAERTETEQWGRVTSIRAFYQDGLEVEFGITRPDWASLPLDEGTERVLRDGYKLVFSREQGLERLLQGRISPLPPGEGGTDAG